MKEESISLAIVDDHQIVIDGIIALLKNHKAIHIAFTTTRPQDVLQLLKQHKTDILLTDVVMPVLNGSALAKKVKETFPDIKIVALSMSGEGSLINEMIEHADISGYLLKNTGKEELITALKKIAGGGIYFCAEALEELRQVQKKNEQLSQIHLTNREIEIIRLIEKEYNNKQIAEALFISEKTVKTHRKNIFRKTGTDSVLGLVKFAYEHKII